jgi:adenosylcobinamide kinase/adenosylcobinamide-phosphate guanylyltransferase
VSEPRRILVTGGVRSGKSRHAERLVGQGPAVYVAPGPTVEEEPDPDWAARIVAHRARRPAAWSTVETWDLAGVIAAADRPVLIDCLGTWLTAVLDRTEAWELPRDELDALVDIHLGGLDAAIASCPHDLVVVTNEVGLGVVPAHRSGRVFRDLLGEVNQRFGTLCDEVHLVVAGRVLML